jgi:protoporphyrinogen oxidase
LPLSFGVGVGNDALRKLLGLRRNGYQNDEATFTTVLERGLGSTICRDFYFPYAVKIWGLPPEELSATQAHRRVSAGSLGKMARKALGLVPVLKQPGAGRFYYPRAGYGQISRAMASAATSLGADIRLNTTVRSVTPGTPHRIELESQGNVRSIQADHIWSTIPVTILSRIANPAAPADVLQASREISYRAMVLIYLVLEQSQWTPFDAHYFPEADVKLTRLSEPKNYSARTEPANRTVLCGELPCDVDDDIWRASDDELAQVVRDSLMRCDLSINSPVLRIVTKRLAFAYPIYRKGYEKHFAKLNEWANSVEGLLTFGRQGLFAHDNTHHALAMAYGAVDCLRESGDFDQEKWSRYRSEFAKHVVED